MVEWIEVAIGILIMAIIGTLITIFILNVLKLKFKTRKSTDEYHDKNTIIKLKPLLIFLLISLFIIVFGKVLYDRGREHALAKQINSGKITFAVKLDSITLDHNDNVGDNWSFEGNVNGVNISKGQEIIISANTNDSLTLGGTAKENDVTPDIGNMNKLILIRDLNISEKYIYPVVVTVREDRSKFEGYTAVWVFNYSIERKIELSDIVSNIF